MDAPAKGRWWQRCRIIFRACRITILLLILVLVAFGGWLNEQGLPDFLKRPLVDELRARGVDLQFSRLRLRWHRGVVAEDVRFESAHPETNAPHLWIKEVQIRLDHSALAHFKLQVDALMLRDGRLVWPVPDTNGPPRQFAATNIMAQLSFLTNNEWRLDSFKAEAAGASMEFSGSISNASDLRDWPIFHPGQGTNQALVEQRLREVADTIEELNFAEPPELEIHFNGDARNPQSFGGVLNLKAAGAVTPWGTITNGFLSVRMTASSLATNLPRTEVILRAGDAATRFARARNLSLRLDMKPQPAGTNLFDGHLELAADEVRTKWATSAAAQLTADWTQSISNWMPQSGALELCLTNAQMSRASAGAVKLNARLNQATNGSPPVTDEQWGPWAVLAPYSLDWNCRVSDVHAEDPEAGKFEFQELDCGGLWRAPELTLTNAHAELYRGKFDARATLDVVTRETQFSATSDFDALKIAPLLTEETRRLLEQYSWEDPPLVHATGGAVLPSWTNSQPDWKREVRPTLWLNGDIAAGNAGFRGVPLSSASLHFYYTNMQWAIPDLVAVRPEGRLEFSESSDDRSQLFHFRIKSTLDPMALRGLAPPDAQPGFDAFIFTRPPVIEGDVWGRWHSPNEIGFNIHVAVTNFALRGESATRFEGDIQYTNEFFILTNGRLDCGDRYATATGLGVDVPGKRAFLTNGFSILSPGPFFHVVGPKIAKVMEPYQFSEPPTVHAYGTIPFTEDVDADLHFQVDGGPFHWTYFNLDHISGGVDWVGNNLALTNVQGAFYGGDLKARAMFDFTPGKGADLSFNIAVTNASIHPLMSDLSLKTNKLEGLLTGQLNISSGNTENFANWAGDGQMQVTDGLLWEFPILGIFSQILDKVHPALGESRATKASGSFTILNSVIYSDDLNIQAPGLVMKYRGTIDFKGNVDATVEASLFRDFPVVGFVFNMATMPFTKLFEYRIVGTLDQPKSKPVFLPAQVPLMILRPFVNPVQTLQNLMPSTETSTNAPAPPAQFPSPTQ